MRIFLLLLIVQKLALASAYSYHPSNALHLSSGFDPAQPEKSFKPCIDYEGRTQVDGDGTLKTEYSLSLVKSRKELFDRLGISASFSARGLFWGAKGEIDYFSQHSFHSDSTTWMLLAKSDFGRQVLKNPKLKPDAQNLINKKLFQDFALQCGTEFVNQERRTGLVAAIFSLENISKEDQKRLEMQFESSLSIKIFEAEAKTSYSKFYSEANRLNRIHISVYAIGGKGITKLTQLISTPDDLNQIQSAIQNYVQDLDEKHAAPHEYLSGSMATFGWKGMLGDGISKRERILGELYHLYEDASSKHARINKLLNLKTELNYSDLDQTRWENYKLLRDGYTEYLEQLNHSADICLKDASVCELPKNKLEDIKWPAELLSKCERTRLQAYEQGLISEDEFLSLQKLNFTPLSSDREIKAYVFCNIANTVDKASSRAQP